MNNIKNRNTREAILRTLAYRSVFSYPVTLYQVYCFLISREKIEFKEFKQVLEKLVREGVVNQKGFYYFIGNSNLKKRISGEAAAIRLLKHASKTLKFFGLLPGVRMIAVTGAVAAGNTFEQDDIDILVVTSANSLWTTRFFVVSLLKILRLYRKDGDESGKICPNIFVSDDNLIWPDKNLFVAHDILMMVPIVDKSGCYAKFLAKNKWVTKFFSNCCPYTPFAEKPSYVYWNPFEKILRAVQLAYMKKRVTNEVVEPKLAHFRRDDHSKKILDSYFRKCKEFGTPPF